MKGMSKRASVFVKGDLDEDCLEAQEKIGNNPNDIGSLCDDKDFLAMHDDLSNVRLADLDPHQFVTGTVVALLGRKLDKTSPFHVLDVCYPQAPLVRAPSSVRVKLEMDVGNAGGDVEMGDSNVDVTPKYVGFLSGPLLAKQNVAANLQRFVEDSPELCHLILAGNSYSDTISKIKKADRIFDGLSEHVSVDIVPGSKDIGTSMFPYEPPGMMLFPKCGNNGRVHATTSPYEVLLENKVRILGTGGEPISDIMRCTRFDGPMDAMVSALGLVFHLFAISLI